MPPLLPAELLPHTLSLSTSLEIAVCPPKQISNKQILQQLPRKKTNIVENIYIYLDMASKAIAGFGGEGAKAKGSVWDVAVDCIATRSCQTVASAASAAAASA